MANLLNRKSLTLLGTLKTSDVLLVMEENQKQKNSGNKGITVEDLLTYLEDQLDEVVGNLEVTGTLTVDDTTDSTSKDTGAVIIEGGMGVEKSIFAGLTINAGTSLTIGTSQTFAKEVDHTISVATSTTAATDGGDLTVQAGTGATTGAGGNTNITGGTGGATGVGGNIVITTGAGGATSGDSGFMGIFTADETGTDASGSTTIATGSTATANSGTMEIATGSVATSGDSGANTIRTGDTTLGGTGDINLTTGNTDSGLAGDIILTTGTHTSTTVCPIISLNKGVVRKPGSSPVASGGTITGPELVRGLIAATGATGNWQLPSCANITTAIGSTPAGTNFEFVFNAQAMTGTNTATLVVGANMSVASAPAITGGGTLTVTQDTQVTAGFRIVYDTATTCKIYRIW